MSIRPSAAVSIHAAPAAQARVWPAACGMVFAVSWLALAWRPLYPQDWALENVLSLCAAWWLIRRHRHAPLSDAAYTLLLLYGLAHELGAHFTYAEVPYDAWIRHLLGFSLDAALGFPRNEYDRLVHFSFGLLCFRPMREAMAASLPPSRGAALALTAAVMTAISALYELLEWAAALAFGGDLGQAYLGTQGDVWDSQKDMALALLGTMIALSCGLAGRPGLSRGATPSGLSRIPSADKRATDTSRAIKAGVAYFGLVFGAGFVLGSIRMSVLVPPLGERLAELIEMPFMFMVVLVSARFICRRFNLPTNVRPRLGAGLLALALLLAAETLTVSMQGRTLGEYVASRDQVSGIAYLGMLALFAAMPLILARPGAVSGV